MKNPLIKKKSLPQKIEEATHKAGKATQKVGKSIRLPGQENKFDKYLKILQQTFLYIAIFLAGYIIGLVQSVIL